MPETLPTKVSRTLRPLLNREPFQTLREEMDDLIGGNSLSIRGERKDEKEVSGKTCHRVERRFGSFSRTITLPCAVQEDHVRAECHDGILTITLPKTEKAKTHKVLVKGKGAGAGQM
jgi:HSP20 family molecular chaperone IbpA